MQKPRDFGSNQQVIHGAHASLKARGCFPGQAFCRPSLPSGTSLDTVRLGFVTSPGRHFWRSSRGDGIMELSRSERSFRSLGMLVLFGSTLIPTTATAALDPMGLGTLVYSAPAAVAARAAVAAYYATTYDNENGPYPTYDAAIQASQTTLWNAVHVWMQGESGFEQGLFIYRDKYWQYWFTTPRQGLNEKIYLPTSEVKRPESSIIAMSHSHPKPKDGYAEIFPEGTGGDNLTGWDQYVQRFGGDIWYYRPNTHEPKLYGVIMNSNNTPVLSTMYSGTNVGKLGENVDLYGLDKKTGGDGSQPWWDRYRKGPMLLQILFVPVALGVFTLIFIGGSGGGTLDGLGTPTPDLGGW